MPDRAPLAVLVSGAPGSGKTTLADALSQGLDIPALHNGQLVHGIWRTLDRASELGASGLEPFYATLELWLDLGVSLVADHTFERGVSEPDVARRLGPRAFLINVHCRSAHAPERFADRMRAERLCGEQRLSTLLPRVHQLQGELVEPLDFGCHTIVVDTDNGYRPMLEAIIAEIDDIFSGPVLHDLDRPG
jgi:chloramphenicol 3-O-phosphotransferase